MLVLDSSGLSVQAGLGYFATLPATTPPTPADRAKSLAEQVAIFQAARHTSYSHSVQGHKP